MQKYLKNTSILFLEDNDQFAKHTTGLLEMFVKTVHRASTSEEAKNLFQMHPIDIIITDIKLHDENGLDFIREIRETEPYIPVVVLSGHKDEKYLFSSIPLGLSAYLLKPIKYDELVDALILCAKKLTFHKQLIIELKEGWSYNTEQKTLQKEGKIYTLNKKEMLFIELLSLNIDRLITKDMIQTAVWEGNDMSDYALTSFILRIRKRFGKTFVYTMADIGFRLNL